METDQVQLHPQLLIHTPAAGIVLAHASAKVDLTSVVISLATVDGPIPFDGSSEYTVSFAIISFVYERNPCERGWEELRWRENRRERVRVHTRTGSRGRTEGKAECIRCIDCAYTRLSLSLSLSLSLFIASATGPLRARRSNRSCCGRACPSTHGNRGDVLPISK